MMNAAEIRLYQNPVLTSILLGLAQGDSVGEKLFPRIPSKLSSLLLTRLGDERHRRYNLRRAPGARTKQVPIAFKGEVYSIDGYSVDVPIARELIREFNAATWRLNLDGNLDVSRIAIETARSILDLDYELECAEFASNESNYASGHSMTLSGSTKWSHPDGKPVTQINDAREVVRRKTGKRPNMLVLSSDAWSALSNNFEVMTYQSSSSTGPATIEDMKAILDIEEIVVGSAIWVDVDDSVHDVWSNVAVLAYVPAIDPESSIEAVTAEPVFGLTAPIEGHPFAEHPYYDPGSKTWVYGATFERGVHILNNTAGFLFKAPY